MVVGNEILLVSRDRNGQSGISLADLLAYVQSLLA